MLDDILMQTRKAQKSLAKLNDEQRNLCLKNIADALMKEKNYILKENKKDILEAKQNHLTEAMIERLTLTEERIKSISNSVLDLIALEDVVYKVIEQQQRPNGIIIEKQRVPFGVIGVIFESRPNVCVDIATLCLKTANACVLKGGKEAIYTNIALTKIMQNAIKDIVDYQCICLIEDVSRSITNQLIEKKEYIDLLIPRGSKGLIDFIVANAKIPYIETGAGNCHLYVHKDADIDMALTIAVNAKYQRPSVCNSIENILVDKEIALEFLPKLFEKFNELDIEIRGCENTIQIIPCEKAKEEDFYTEYNDYIVSVKVVDHIADAIQHINEHSSKHSETIISNNEEASKKFLSEIDSACVYHNASTRFTDGGEFGFGAEVGISTQKLHARGPMGLKEICSYKYKIYGNGQVR